MLEILKDDPERWFIARETTIGALFGITPNISRVKCFGNVPNGSRPVSYTHLTLPTK